MKRVKEALAVIEERFGYDLASFPELRKALTADLEDSRADGELEEGLESILLYNVYSELEGGLTAEPAEGGFSPRVLASHWLGLFGVTIDVFAADFQGSAFVRVDVNEPGAGGIHLWDHAGTTPEEILSPPVFASLKEQRKADEVYFELKTTTSDAKEQASLARRKRKFEAAHPQLVLHHGKSFARYAIAAPPGTARAPLGPLAPFLAPALFFADRFAGEKVRAPAGLEVLAARKAPGLPPPGLLLKLFALHHLGRDKEAAAWAGEIRRKSLGVALTRRWAGRYLDGHDFFAAIAG
jgi:hypothetical protein